MGKSHPIALRERVVAFVEEGHGHREAARHFRVSPRFVNDLVILKRETGSLSPRRQEHLGRQACRSLAALSFARLLPPGRTTSFKAFAAYPAYEPISVITEDTPGAAQLVSGVDLPVADGIEAPSAAVYRLPAVIDGRGTFPAHLFPQEAEPCCGGHLSGIDPVSRRQHGDGALADVDDGADLPGMVGSPAWARL